MSPHEDRGDNNSSLDWSGPGGDYCGGMTLPWPHVPFDLQGHRGARGLAPESTLASFDAALAVGVTGLEFDVRLTGDGQVVVWHDPTLQADKCTFEGRDLTGARLDDLTLADLRTVDIGARTLAAYPQQKAAPGSRILTLAELFARYADRTDLWWTVEVKVDPTDARDAADRHTLTEKTVALIHDAGLAERAFVHSFDWAVLEIAAALDATLHRSALAIPGVTYAPDSPWLGSIRYAAHGDDLAGAAAAVGAVVLSPYFPWCTPENVARAHEVGLGVLPWTVNERADLAAMRDAGVDGVVTDYPDRVDIRG